MTSRRPLPLTKKQRVRDRAATLSIGGWHLYVDGRLWTVLEVATNGEVLAFCDAPYSDPGVAYHRWLSVEEFDEAINESLARRFGW